MADDDEGAEEPPMRPPEAEQNGADEPEGRPGLCEWIDEVGTLYDREENPFIQRVRIKGGIDLQYGIGWSDAGRFDSGDVPREDRWGPIEVRRFRLGTEVDFLREFTFDAQANLQGRAREVYGDIYQLHVEWNRYDAFRPSVGKIRIPFTQEYTIPDSRIVTIERSLLVELLLPTTLTGVMVAGEIDNWSYRTGAFAADDRDEFSRFNQGAALFGKVTYDFTDQVRGLDKLMVGADYLFSTTQENTGTAPYRHAVAIYNDVDLGDFNLLSEVIYGSGFGAVPDVYGVNFIPSMFVYRDKLQLVARYQFAVSDGPGGLRLRERYERLAPDLQFGGVGRRYQAVYGGVNWYLCNPNIKVMTGLEYHHMAGGQDGDDFSGLTLAVAFRFWF